MKWGDARRGPRKSGFDPAWTAALQAVGHDAVFRSEMLRYAYDTYGRKLIVALAWLGGAADREFGSRQLYFQIKN